MSISGIGGASIQPIEFPKLDGVGSGAKATGGSDFASSLTNAIDNVQQTQATSDSLAAQAATGKLENIHDYMIASTQAEIATQLTVAVRNKAVDAFNQIMNMQV